MFTFMFTRSEKLNDIGWRRRESNRAEMQRTPANQRFRSFARFARLPVVSRWIALGDRRCGVGSTRGAGVSSFMVIPSRAHVRRRFSRLLWVGDLAKARLVKQRIHVDGCYRIDRGRGLTSFDRPRSSAGRAARHVRLERLDVHEARDPQLPFGLYRERAASDEPQVVGLRETEPLEAGALRDGDRVRRDELHRHRNIFEHTPRFHRRRPLRRCVGSRCHRVAIDAVRQYGPTIHKKNFDASWLRVLPFVIGGRRGE